MKPCWMHCQCPNQEEHFINFLCAISCSCERRLGRSKLIWHYHAPTVAAPLSEQGQPKSQCRPLCGWRLLSGAGPHAGAPVMTLARTSLPATGAPSTSSTAGLVFSCSMACLARPRALAAHPRAPPAKRLPGRPWLTLACKQAVLTGLLISTVTRAGTRTGHRPAARGSLAERLQPRGRAPIRLGARRPQARAGSGRAPTCTRTPGGWCSAGARTARTGW